MKPSSSCAPGPTAPAPRAGFPGTPSTLESVESMYRYSTRGRPLLSRPRGAVDSGLAAVLAAVESAAVSAVAWSCGCVVGFGWMVVRFVRVIRAPACAPVSRVSRVCPGSPPYHFTGTGNPSIN